MRTTSTPIPTLLRRLGAPALAGLAALAVGLASPSPAAAACADVSAAYPGDAAAKGSIAAWMAGGAVRAGLPGELPVMAALVESDLENLPGGDADSVGYFQMRTSFWDTGKYQGYATNPPLQLQWFIDEATPRAKGRAADETQWGEWIADTERPAAQYRGRYQLRLGEARTLIAPGCAAATGVGSPPPDTVPPVVTIGARGSQRVARTHAVLLAAGCPAEACTVSAAVRIVGSGLRRPARSSARAQKLAAGVRGQFRLVLNGTLRRAAARAYARRSPLRATVTVTARDAAGNAGTASRTIRLA